ncbi:hypothetical protein RESH_04645 [Rhodopirellula europaea SH398]|uniref:Uncharacterized protein n=1 Tax=Rhodopirellula europaea SH398 TaxID=1263868 RepID=M5RZI8_9BACT|nr:hypothetical protein RESH_04645 [Rhodopirellula europaea SH398]
MIPPILDFLISLGPLFSLGGTKRAKDSKQSFHSINWDGEIGMNSASAINQLVGR